MKYRWILLLFITALSLSANSKADTSSTVSNQEITGKVTYLEGEVQIDGQIAELGDIVQSGDTVETGEAGFCEVQFLGQNVFQIQEQTLLTLSFKPNNAEIDLKQGSMAALFNKLENLTSESPFRISTPTSTAGIRGTAFFVAIEDENNSYFCACNGSLFTDPGDGSEGVLLESGHHKAIRFTRTDEGITHQSAALLYHDDATMDALATSIGETIPWDYYNSSY